jgi:radical SAM superfamily enzyme YgiQ (UPF0313 family)
LGPVRVLLLSTYELGHQPLHVASATAALRAAGHRVRAVDLAVEEWDDEAVDWADGVALPVPMHTAGRLAERAATRVRGRRPGIPLCVFGLYAIATDWADGLAGVARFAGEFERGLVAWANGGAAGEPVVDLARRPSLGMDRDVLPAIDRYARLEVGAELRLVGSVEASRGCAHRCRHCPVPVVYGGRVRPVDEDAVLADIASLVGAGARHISFSDPDFLNVPQHSQRVVAAMHAAYPELTFDCTVKVEHILRHRSLWSRWSSAGCLFVVSAIECVSDDILRRLDKGHTAADAGEAVGVMAAAGIPLRPSFLPFTPWTELDDVLALLHFVVEHDLVGDVDPVQYTIRLLVPRGSLLLDDPDLAARIGPYDAERQTYPWSAPDPRVDRLQQELASLVERDVREGTGLVATFLDVNAEVHAAAGLAVPVYDVEAGSTEGRPRLTEPWFC